MRNGKGKRQNSGNTGGRRPRQNRRNPGNGKNRLWMELALCGIIPDIKLDGNELRNARDIALIALPGKPGDGRLQGYTEIFTTMLVATGVPIGDAAEILKLVAGTGQAIHWTEIPDFDSSAENSNERAAAKASGSRWLAAYESAAALRKKISKEESKDDKKVAGWRGQFPGA